MKIDVEKVAILANLTITPEEKTEFESQLSDIVGYIEKLNSIDTTSIEPTAQVTGLTNKMRDDSLINDSFSPETALSGATDTHNQMFVVEKLVDTTS